LHFSQVNLVRSCLIGDVSSLEDQSFIMKEGTAYNIRINFCVQREIASGLRLRITTARKGING